MVIDSSALVAILLQEPEAAALESRLEDEPACVVATVTLLDASIVLTARVGPEGRRALNALIDELGIEVASFDRVLGDLAADAFEAFGKGRHPANLNFGDCCAYALARRRGEPLLFKGNDFTRTDVVPAL